MAQTTSPTHTNFSDLETLMRVKSLELRSRIVVQGFLGGLHRSPYHGFSVEFSEYRQYTPGDDPRYLDWKLFARSDRYYIKRYRDETNLRCTLIVDLSKSMKFTSQTYSKAAYAVTLAATLATFLTGQRDAVGLITFSDIVHDYLPSRYRPGHLHRIMGSLDRAVWGNDTDIVTPLKQIAELIHKRGLKILISDLLVDSDILEPQLGMLRARGHEVVVFQILDPAEQNLAFDQPAVFEDLETGRDLYVDPAISRAEYQEKLQAHLDKIEQCCNSLGAEYHLLTTDTPLEFALLDYLCQRASVRM